MSNSHEAVERVTGQEACAPTPSTPLKSRTCNMSKPKVVYSISGPVPSPWKAPKMGT